MMISNTCVQSLTPLTAAGVGAPLVVAVAVGRARVGVTRLHQAAPRLHVVLQRISEDRVGTVTYTYVLRAKKGNYISIAGEICFKKTIE